VKRTLAIGVLGLTLVAGPAEAADRTEVLFFGAEYGLGWANLRAVEYDGLLPSVTEKSGSGSALGLHGFLRLWILAVGLHAQVIDLDDFDVWQTNLEGQLRLPSEILEFYFKVGIGYAFLGTDFQGEDPTINGWDGLAGLGIDFFLKDWISIGPAFDLTFLNLTRSGSLTAIDATAAQEGSAVGVGIHFCGVLSLRI
jgi:hypothetical protein